MIPMYPECIQMYDNPNVSSIKCIQMLLKNMLLKM